MSKAVRINVLVITVVVTLFVFLGLWFMRPGVPNEILEQARQRQTVPLMEVQPPVKKPVVQEVSNTQALAKELLPTLKQELEGSLTDSIRSKLLSDQALVDQLSKSVEGLLTASLQTQLEASLSSFRLEIQSATMTELQALNNRLQTEAIAYGSKIQSDVSQQLGNNKAELLSLLPQLVDAKIPQVVEQVVAQLEANKDSYLAIMRESLAPSLQEADLLALYDSYRDQIVLDLVPQLLDGIEETVKTEVNTYVSAMPLVRVPAAPTVSSPSVKVVAVPEPMSIEVVVAQPPVIQAEPVELVAVPAQPKVVQPKPEPVAVSAPPVAEPTSPLAPMVPKTIQPVIKVEAPPVPKQGQPVITVPTFEEKTTVVFLEPEEYELKRQEIRTKAIEDVLKRIAP